MAKMKYWDGKSWVVLDAKDADTLDGKHAADFADAVHAHSDIEKQLDAKADGLSYKNSILQLTSNGQPLGNEVVISGGSGGSANMFRGGITTGSFTATADGTKSFTINGLNSNKLVELNLKNLVLVSGVDYTVNLTTGLISLTFELKKGETIYYAVENISFDYGDLINTPNLNLKADKTYADDIKYQITSGRNNFEDTTADRFSVFSRYDKDNPSFPVDGELLFKGFTIPDKDAQYSFQLACCMYNWGPGKKLYYRVGNKREDWQQVATLGRTPISLIPNTGYTIVSDLSHRINDILYISLMIKTSNGTSINTNGSWVDPCKLPDKINKKGRHALTSVVFSSSTMTPKAVICGAFVTSGTSIGIMTENNTISGADSMLITGEVLLV